MRRLLLVASGGAAGAVVRVAVGEIARAGTVLPLSTLLVNLAGAFALGMVVARLGQDPARGAVARPLIAVGFLGALTTFSAFALEVVLMPPLAALLYVAVTLAAGLASAWAGLRLGRPR